MKIKTVRNSIMKNKLKIVISVFFVLILITKYTYFFNNTLNSNLDIFNTFNIVPIIPDFLIHFLMTSNYNISTLLIETLIYIPLIRLIFIKDKKSIYTLAKVLLFNLISYIFIFISLLSSTIPLEYKHLDTNLTYLCILIILHIGIIASFIKTDSFKAVDID